MVVFWKVLLTILILYTIAVDGNRARRRRRQAPMGNPNLGANSMNQQQLPPHPQVLNGPGQPPSQQGGPNDFGLGKQGGRQYYSPYQGQYGYGSVQGLNYPYAGAGVGSYQYGTGQYGQSGLYGQAGVGQYGLYGQGGMGQYGQGGMGQYGSYYNQYPGSNSFYSGYGSGGYNNRPGYSSYPSGGNYGGGYFWNAGQKQNINMFTVFLSSLLTLVICLIKI